MIYVCVIHTENQFGLFVVNACTIVSSDVYTLLTLTASLLLMFKHFDEDLTYIKHNFSIPTFFLCSFCSVFSTEAFSNSKWCYFFNCMQCQCTSLWLQFDNGRTCVCFSRVSSSCFVVPMLSPHGMEEIKLFWQTNNNLSLIREIRLARFCFSLIMIFIAHTYSISSSKKRKLQQNIP